MNKEFVNLNATQRLMELLASMNHQIAYKMVECVKYRWKSPISFLDFGDTNDTVSFINAPKVWELMDKCGDDYKVQAWVSNRSCIKIGKAIKMIYGDSFPINQPKGTIAPKPPVDIESFVNMFKAERDKNKNYERFELVKGRDIKYWYNQKNYSRFIQEDTTLAKSCLRYEESGKFLEMYVNNPDLVNMLILKDDVDKLRGRALVWHLTYPEGRIYMERIYTINDSDVELYKKYAREQGWLYKSRQTYGYQHNIVDGKTNEELFWENFTMKVQLHRKPAHFYPYLDTLCVYNPETGVISNEGKLLRRAPYIKLSDHQGSYVDEADHREMVFSNHYNDEIPREEAEFVNLDQDWVFQQDVVYVHNSNGKKSHRNSPLICESSIIGNRKYFLKEDCVWSEYLKTFIYKESSREGFLDSAKTNKVIIHRRMIGKYFDVDGEGYLIKKKIDASMPFEKYMESKGLSMRTTKRIQVEKLYKEWEFSRTINWNEPEDNTDTEEVTPRPSHRYGNNPWDNGLEMTAPSPRRSEVRDGGLTQRFRPSARTAQSRVSEPRVESRPSSLDELLDHDPSDRLLRYVQQGLVQSSGIPSAVFNTTDNVTPQQSDQAVGRAHRVQVDDPIDHFVVRREGEGQSLRFTVSGQGRPIEEERPMAEPTPEQTDDDIVVDWGDVNVFGMDTPSQEDDNTPVDSDEVATSAEERTPHDNSHHWYTQSFNYDYRAWIHHPMPTWRSTSNENTDNNTDNR